MMDKNTNMLVFSGHSADFVWRSGGVIAKYIKHGANVTVVVLSYGVRGESNDLWKIEGQTAENVKKMRSAEVGKAAKILGIKNIEFWDFEDYPMVFTAEKIDRMVRKIREVNPDIILTHAPKDSFNPDHENISKYVHQASVMATSAGVKIEGLKHTTQMKIFGFEPHQTEISEFMPNTIIDITECIEEKKAAMNCFTAQKHLIEYYTNRAGMRGNHARRISGVQDYKFAESFMRLYPYVGGEFV